MKHNVLFSLSVFILWGALLSSGYAGHSGNIIFSGKVVSGVCQLSQKDSTVIQTCVNNGRTIKNKMIVNRKGATPMFSSENNKSTMSFSWLERSKGIAIVKIAYD